MHFWFTHREAKRRAQFTRSFLGVIKCKKIFLAMRKIILAVLCAIASASTDIDWTRVKPLSEYPEFWIGKALQPPAEYFERLKNPIDSHITNGNVAGRHDFPFKAALVAEMPFGQSLCGGSVISRWVSHQFQVSFADFIYEFLSVIVSFDGGALRLPLDQRFSRSRRIRFD